MIYKNADFEVMNFFSLGHVCCSNDISNVPSSQRPYYSTDMKKVFCQNEMINDLSNDPF
jgi:hypothetical protein